MILEMAVGVGVMSDMIAETMLLGVLYRVRRRRVDDWPLRIGDMFPDLSLSRKGRYRVHP